MKLFGKWVGVFVLTFIVGLGGLLVAGQVGTNYLATGNVPLGNRSDGLFLHRVNHSLIPVIDGVEEKSVSKGFHLDFTVFGDGSMKTKQYDNTAVDLQDEVQNLIILPNGYHIGFAMIEDSTAGPDMDAGSLDIGADQTDNEGIELWMNQFGAHADVGYFVGDDAAFFTCATMSVEDVSGADDLHVGFRLVGATNDAFDDYTDAAAIGPLSGNVTIETILNNAGTTATDTGFDYGDAETAREYCVYVSAAGVASFTYNGVLVEASSTFTFDDNDELVPFIYSLHAAHLAGEIDVTNWEAGYQ
jgi:hypothetical protein